MSAEPNLSESERLEAAADAAIATCEGDLHMTVKSLILANEFLEHEVKELMVAVSKGYSRSKRHDVPDPLPRDRKDWYD